MAHARTDGTRAGRAGLAHLSRGPSRRPLGVSGSFGDSYDHEAAADLMYCRSQPTAARRFVAESDGSSCGVASPAAHALGDTEIAQVLPLETTHTSFLTPPLAHFAAEVVDPDGATSGPSLRTRSSSRGYAGMPNPSQPATMSPAPTSAPTAATSCRSDQPKTCRPAPAARTASTTPSPAVTHKTTRTPTASWRRDGR
jgi:hypothetical protein